MHDSAQGLFTGRTGTTRRPVEMPPLTTDPSLGPVVLLAQDVHVRYRIRMARSTSRAAARVLPTRTASQEIHAVRGVSGHLREGQCLGIVGDNGAGKSSLVRALAGFEMLASGTVLAASAPRLFAVGGAAKPAWTGLETIEASLRAMKVPLNRRRYLTQDIIDFTELGERLKSPVATYSRGMQGRLRFAINTAVSAQILCIDEGIGGADGRFRERANERISRMLGNAGALILVSHSMESIRKLATDAIWLHEGQVVLAGPVENVTDAYKNYLDTSTS